jgi:hypothetical protein
VLGAIRDICHGCDTLQLIQNKKHWLCSECIFKKNHDGKSREEVYKERSNRTTKKVKRKSETICQGQKGEGGKQERWGNFKVAGVKKASKIKHVSNKRAIIERELRLVYNKIDNERELCCEGCGSYVKPLSHSHLLSRYFRPDLIADPQNIRLHCFGDYNSCHEKWERGSPLDIVSMLDFRDNLMYIRGVDVGAYNNIIANFEFNGVSLNI